MAEDQDLRSDTKNTTTFRMSGKMFIVVATFLEGTNQETFDDIARVGGSIQGCKLLHVGADTVPDNTIYTLAGKEEPVSEALIAMSKRAAESIDVSQRTDTKIGLGVLDLCAVSPYGDSTMDDCVKLSRTLGEKLAKEFDIPVYLLWESATREDLRSLPPIKCRKVAGFTERIQHDDPWKKPDYGTATFNQKWCATLIGAQKFTPVFNVNLTTTDLKVVQEVCYLVRTSGRPKQREQHGDLPAVKATAWISQIAPVGQVAMFLLNTDVTGLHRAYEACRRRGQELQTDVVSSEVVGMIPLKVMLEAASSCMSREEFDEASEEKKIKTVIECLGLDKMRRFDPKTRILEYAIRD
ncbi:formimidoyltransferase-cyclodeaminase-like [Diadema setosum]|uniref:formimidoyltransferase-cyclodeaminase-like n=1 Tax=Diadema setosum TaxID=31175 RepID=UPI003B3B3524